jgi:hypothetical protein
MAKLVIKGTASASRLRLAAPQPESAEIHAIRLAWEDTEDLAA